MRKKPPKLIVLLGPTASGKTDLAIKLAKKFNGEIVNADSRNVYRGMFIGTASPFVSHHNPPPFRGGGRRGSDIRNACWKISGIPHHLFHYIEPWEPYSVGRYKQDATTAIDDIILRGKMPILVGGTGLYVWAVVDNLAIPEVPPNPKLRKNLELRIRNKGLKLLWSELTRLDPEAAEFVQKDNPRRVIRALEVMLTTGKKFSELRQKGAPLYKVLQIGIKAPLPKLDRRIDARVDQQIKDGLVKETRKILGSLRSPTCMWGSGNLTVSQKKIWQLPSMTSLGYRQIGMFLRGEVSREEAIRILKRDTRRYARRQMTWFRRDKRIKWLESKGKIERAVDRFLAL